MGSDKAVPLLNKVVTDDQSPMVRRLAREALRKIDGEMPVERRKQIASEQELHTPVPTDQKFDKIRELDKKLGDEER
jgi:hypothetical protein